MTLSLPELDNRDLSGFFSFRRISILTYIHSLSLTLTIPIDPNPNHIPNPLPTGN